MAPLCFIPRREVHQALVNQQGQLSRWSNSVFCRQLKYCSILIRRHCSIISNNFVIFYRAYRIAAHCKKELLIQHQMTADFFIYVCLYVYLSVCQYERRQTSIQYAKQVIVLCHARSESVCDGNTH